MFVVTDADAAAIRTAFDQGGEFSAAVELRQRFPGIPDNATCTGVRSGHRRLEAAAAAQDQAKITSAPGVRSPGRSRGRLAAPRARTVRLWMRETVEEIARPPVTGCTVLSHPRHEIWPMRLAACNGQKRHEQGQRER